MFWIGFFVFIILVVHAYVVEKTNLGGVIY